MNAQQILAAVLFLAVTQTEAFSGGAPIDQCMNMTPDATRHGAPAQITALPYTIRSEWMPAQNKYMVKLVPTATTTPLPKGIMMQARMPGSTTPWGTFTLIASSPTKLLQCTTAGSTVTHNAANPGSDFSVYWSPPTGQTGQVQFVATVVQSQTVYWVRQQSAAITVTAANSKGGSGGSAALTASGILTVITMAMAKLF